jgi:hypothetical protein
MGSFVTGGIIYVEGKPVLGGGLNLILQELV